VSNEIATAELLAAQTRQWAAVAKTILTGEKEVCFSLVRRWES
jgi:hypothetical protein